MLERCESILTRDKAGCSFNHKGRPKNWHISFDYTIEVLGLDSLFGTVFSQFGTWC